MPGKVPLGIQTIGKLIIDEIPINLRSNLISGGIIIILQIIVNVNFHHFSSSNWNCDPI